MLKMVWDSEVAMVAQKWAENCDISHDENYQRLVPGILNRDVDMLTIVLEGYW